MQQLYAVICVPGVADGGRRGKFCSLTSAQPVGAVKPPNVVAGLESLALGQGGSVFPERSMLRGRAQDTDSLTSLRLLVMGW